MMKEETIFSSTTGTSTDVLTEKSIRKAIKALKEYSQKPFITCIKSKDEWWKTIQKSPDIRSFSLYGGIQVFKDEEIPDGIARFMMSDGTHKDIDITYKPTFLTK